MLLFIFSSLFIDCLRNAFSLHLEKLRNFCSLPWMRSMTNIRDNLMDIMNRFTSCNSSIEFYIADEFTSNFSALAANYAHPSCKGKYNTQILLKRSFYISLYCN